MDKLVDKKAYLSRRSGEIELAFPLTDRSAVPTAAHSQSGASRLREPYQTRRLHVYLESPLEVLFYLRTVLLGEP